MIAPRFGEVSTLRSERFKEALRRRKVGKLYALAIALGVNESAVSRWKNGGPISADNAMRVCEHLDISVDWLLMGRGHMDQHKQFSLTNEELEFITLLRKLSPETAACLKLFLESLVGAHIKMN